MAQELLHFDPLTVAILVIGFIGTWYTLKSDSKWHTEWIKKHSAECDAREATTTKIFAELTTSNAKLTTLAETHDHRLERVEGQLDRYRQAAP